MSKPRIYLAGSQNREENPWRHNLMVRWEDQFELIDPWVEHDQTVIGHFATKDLDAVSDADLVFAMYDYQRQEGTSLEIGYALALGIPVVTVWMRPKIAPLSLVASMASFTELEPAIEFVEEWFDGIAIEFVGEDLDASPS